MMSNKSLTRADSSASSIHKPTLLSDLGPRLHQSVQIFERLSVQVWDLKAGSKLAHLAVHKKNPSSSAGPM